MYATNAGNQRGFVAVTAALVIVVLLTFSGLAIDVGYMMLQKRQAQAAADAAAQGGLKQLQAGGNSAEVLSAGRDDAALNGFTHQSNRTSVQVNNPPLSGSFTGNANAVEAVISRTVPTFFLMLAGKSSATVSARAVAVQTNGGTGLGGCIFALSKTASDALLFSGGSTYTTACSAVVESKNSNALKMNGSVTLNLETNARVGVIGGWNLTGQARLYDITTGKTVQPVRLTADPGDPLRKQAPPTAAGLTIRGTNLSYDMNNIPANYTLQPGIYCGGLRVGNTGGRAYTMAPGTYVMAGGGVTLNSQARITANGVTIYNSTGSGWGCASSASAGAFTLDGQAQLNMTAPTSGPLLGIAIFEDRALSGLTNKLVGGSSSTIDGALYFPNSALVFSGNSSVSGYLVLVAQTIEFNGNSMLKANYTSLATPNLFVASPTGGVLSE